MTMRGSRIWPTTAALAAVGAILTFVQVNERNRTMKEPVPSSRHPADGFAGYSSALVEQHLGLMFLHHSVGEQWLADPEGVGGNSHANGGRLRRALESNGYQVRDATYGSRLGEKTDLFDWLPKFTGHLDEVLRTAHQDDLLPQGERSQIVLFKSCFPNSYFNAQGTEPGNPNGPDLTVANARASFRALLPIFARSPETLFVFVTTPPVVGGPLRERLGKVLVKRLLGRPLAAECLSQQARLAREFRDWIIAPDGWLATYALKNVVVFDYYDVLTKHGSSLFLEYPSGDGRDNHPNRQGNQAATAEFVPFLNRAVRRMRHGG
jgi:hypothetical protein